MLIKADTYNGMRPLVEFFLPPSLHTPLRGLFSGEQGEQSSARAVVCPGSSAPRPSRRSGPVQAIASHPPTTPWPTALLFHEVSEMKVWLCCILQTLPKVTPGVAPMEEGVFPES